MDKINWSDGLSEFCKALGGDGAFLVVRDDIGRGNPMTIGWGTLGLIWGIPMVSVLVRPSRHTFTLVEKVKSFSVNIPSKPMAKELAFCGSHSGREHDKMAECGLTAEPGLASSVLVIKDCGLIYECETVGKIPLTSEALHPEVIERFYPEGDFHTVFFGKILHAYRQAPPAQAA
jgi:flavin reductase (DIM6/NTAB) family NADH-FMN oxidoreductase RutF